MPRPRRFVPCLALLVTLAGAHACGNGKKPDTDPKPSAMGGAPIPEDVPRLNDVYKDAYTRAEQLITTDNVHDRLATLERLVRRELEDLEP